MQGNESHTSSDTAQALANWYVRLSTAAADESDRAAFEAWLADSPERQQLHATLSRGLDALDAAAVDSTIFDERLAGVIARGKAEPVCDEEHAVATPFRRPTVGRRAVAIAALAASVAGIVVAIFVWQSAAPKYTTVSTAIGDIREVKLADGSTVFANTDTQFDYAMSANSRLVTLKRGEAYFQVAKDKARPFVVTVGKHNITVTGTEFNVKYVGNTAELSVTEGTTRLSERSIAFGLGGEAAVAVVSGVRAIFADDKPVALTRQMDVASAGSWRTGTLIYRDKPLTEIIADLDRYLPSRLQITSAAPEAAQRHFSVLLQVSDEATMLDRIRLLLPVTVREVRQGIYEVDVK